MSGLSTKQHEGETVVKCLDPVQTIYLRSSLVRISKVVLRKTSGLAVRVLGMR